MSEPYMNPMFLPLYNTFTNVINNPTGRWEDYNTAHQTYETLVKFSQDGWFDRSLLPPEPDPSDYPEL